MQQHKEQDNDDLSHFLEDIDVLSMKWDMIAEWEKKQEKKLFQKQFLWRSMAKVIPNTLLK